MARPWTALAVVGGLLFFGYPETYRFSGLARDLGETFLVAAIAAFVFDLSSRNQLMEGIAKDLAARIRVEHLPSQLAAPVEDILYRVDLVRHNLRAEYRIEVADASHVLVRIDHAYEVRNHARGPIPYRPLQAEEAVYHPVFEYLECRHEGADSYVWNAGRLAGEVVERRAGRVKEIQGAEIMLQPKGSPGDTCVVRWQFRLKMPRAYTHILSFGGATVGVEITLVELPPDFHFEATTIRDDVAEHAPDSRVWRYDRAFLKEQHLRVWWWPE